MPTRQRDLGTQDSAWGSIKEFFKIKRKISVEQLCQEFYDSVVFYETDLDNKPPSGYWDKTLEFVTRDKPELATVDRALFQQEMRSLWMELFGLAMKDSLSERDMSRDKSIPYLQSEIMFTKRYLREDARLEVWRTMCAYNKAIAYYGERKAGGHARKERMQRYANKLVEAGLHQEYATRLGNRFCGISSQGGFDHLTAILAQRLGWDLQAQSEPFLQLNTVALWLYCYAKGTVDSVNFRLKGEENDAQKSLLSDSVKKAVLGVLWIVGACWFLLYIGGNPLNELALIRCAQTVPGFIVDTWEDVVDDEHGRTHWFHSTIYKYRIPDGREFTQTEEGSGRPTAEFRNLTYPYPIEVEFLPGKPAVSRIKGSGHSSTLGWLVFKVGLGSLLLVLFCIPGMGLLRDAARDFRRLYHNRLSGLPQLKVRNSSERV